MIFLDKQTDIDINIDKLEEIAQSLSQRDIELIICDDQHIADLNKKYRSKKKPTDVLSFPLEGDMPHMPLGTIVISSDHAAAKAGELGHNIKDEIALLFIHGLLHLLGYDHENDYGEMRAKEHQLIKDFNLPESLIVRTEES